MSHAFNYTAGWWLLLAAFVTGAIIGLGFHHEDFLGGYGSFRRRMLRLGHIALAALGMLNILYGLAPQPDSASTAGRTIGMLLLAGAVAMPSVCFLAAWRAPWRHLFALPVVLLAAAVIGILFNLPP